MYDSNVSILFDKLNQRHVIPDGIDQDVNGLMILIEIMSKTVDSDRFSSWCKFSRSVLNKVVNHCLKNGYNASITVNPSLAQHCFNELMNINSINTNSQDQELLLELIKVSKEKKTSTINKNGSLIRSETCEESLKNSSGRINIAEHKEDSSNSDSNYELDELRVCKRPALGNRFPAHVIERKKPDEKRLIKKAVNLQSLHEGSDDSDELFKPSTIRTVVKSKEKLVNNKSAYSTKNSESQILNDTRVQNKVKSRTHAHKLYSETSESESDGNTHNPNSRVNLNRHFTQKDKIRNQSNDSKSDDLADDDALSESREKRTKKRCFKKLKYKNRNQSSDSGSDDDALSEYKVDSGRTKARYNKKLKHNNRVDCNSEDGMSSKEKIPARYKKANKTEPASKDKKPASKDKNTAAQNRGRSSNSKKPASRRSSSVDSDSRVLSPVPKPKSRSRSTDAMLRSIKAFQTDSESSPSTKIKKDDIKSKSSKFKTDKPTKPENKKEQKESSKPKRNLTNKQSSHDPLKQTANKPVDSSKSKTKANVKNNGKKLENKNEETLEKLNMSKFVQRLQQLESSILKGTPDPLEKNKAIKKKAPATQSQMNKSEAEKSKDTVNSKTKPPSKNIKKSPAVKTQKKPANKKTPVKKAPTKKVPTKKSQKPTNKSKNKENIESTVSKDINKLNNREKTDLASDERGAVASNQVQTAKPDSINVSEKEDKNDPESFFSSEEDSELDSEPELGTLSACMNSIKRKIPRQTGTATPPLKIFLSSMCDAQSDILESEGSSFSNVPLKLDDKNIVKRMAKANKPKETVKQDFSVKKLTKTPEALKKIMKLKNKCDAESSFECSSFSDDD